MTFRDAKGSLAYVFQDWKVNGSAKSRFILVLFRSAQLAKRLPRPLGVFGIPYLGFYKVLVEWIFGIELPSSLRVGPNLWLGHGHALVVEPNTTIGANCFLRQSTTIGRKRWPTAEDNGREAVMIGNNVDIGSNVVILGPIAIGDNVAIGAGSVVVEDVPDGAVVVGNPARIIRIRESRQGYPRESA